MKSSHSGIRRIALFAVVGLSVGGALVSGASAAEEETLGNNLSVPLVVVPSASPDNLPTLRGGACGESQMPTGPRSTQYPGYYLQKTEAMWQAACSTALSANVIANWGDNLISRPIISARQPVRVEVALEQMPSAPMTGFVVENLTPDLEDRNATYGTQGVATPFSTVRVFDSGAMLRIERVDGPGGIVYEGPIAAEVNSTGAVVYGYNWGVKGKSNRALPGTYLVTFMSNHTTITAVDPGDAAKATFGPKSTSVTVTLSSSAGRRGGEGSGSGSGGGGGSGGGSGHGGAGQGGSR